MTSPTKSTRAMRIIELQISNIKRIIAVDIAPNSPLVRINGQNGSGKSSRSTASPQRSSMGVRIPLAIRFWRHVEKRGADECWIWTASTDTHGYGHLKLDGKVVLAHRVSWALANNTVLPDLWVLHKCDNPPCVNPAHLFLGTRTDNVRDMLAKGRRPPVRLIGERNPMAKLSESDIPIIQRRVASGDRRADVAIAYQVSDATIDLIVARKRWASVE